MTTSFSNSLNLIVFKKILLFFFYHHFKLSLFSLSLQKILIIHKTFTKEKCNSCRPLIQNRPDILHKFKHENVLRQIPILNQHWISSLSFLLTTSLSSLSQLPSSPSLFKKVCKEFNNSREIVKNYHIRCISSILNTALYNVSI